ncbi:SLC45 family MFS transporter [Lentilactobacillus hilgardii]|uniref:Transporter, major facilitator family protein n=2 Tax=Lentilactobacillus hilgardii TaxID=1588 RepID=C0XK15_LENH9|nr:SLC45 family MFS transporter [Lentilactobacillus hilgardii]EEI20470.1 transporter, major facilitator family protein [Lentilactobacillus buchneri ATCC 11577]EEI24283.1 transporter, major facilitator family protein [Lentilactobacillus hilgardii DSM 20176 = ATCC 8290]KRK56692.1 major facilitator superfamily permease [Lentilactobacillus hilgardii DSM 20176 = ATCC 8290]MCP9332804.1 SLC45 family MFS transporter [Lentilactobacillus hilgardii]MCP9349447.1 SLC45 family MFS transporter [Lentilactobac
MKIASSNDDQSVTQKTVSKVSNHLPLLSKTTIFAMTFGFFGVNMAFALQQSQLGRIFQTIGTDPNKLGFFFILPPLAGMVIQPLIGKYSDRTWNRFGRRMPYLLIGAPAAAIVLILLPNAGSFGFGYGSAAALWFAAVATLFMDLTSNVCMQPFKMVIGDMVNEDQKDLAWSWQQSFSNLGGVVAALIPFVLAFIGIPNVAAKGEVPLTVRIAFYMAAGVLLITSALTIIKVHEYNPEKYAAYHGIDVNQKDDQPGLLQLLKDAPKIFWEISVVQFFTWFAILYSWTYATGAISLNVWHTSNPSSIGYQAAGNWFGVLTCIQSVAAVLWGLLVQSRTKPSHRKFWYQFGLAAGAIGFISIFFIHSKYLLIIPFVLIGITYLVMNTQPFSLLTEALNGKHEGSYLGLFNCSICLPQIVASIASFWIFPLVGHSMPGMFLVGGISLILATFSVRLIHSKFD